MQYFFQRDVCLFCVRVCVILFIYRRGFICTITWALPPLQARAIDLRDKPFFISITSLASFECAMGVREYDYHIVVSIKTLARVGCM